MHLANTLRFLFVTPAYPPMLSVQLALRAQTAHRIRCQCVPHLRNARYNSAKHTGNRYIPVPCFIINTICLNRRFICFYLELILSSYKLTFN